MDFFYFCPCGFSYFTKSQVLLGTEDILLYNYGQSNLFLLPKATVVLTVPSLGS